jgi:hypothetical protein
MKRPQMKPLPRRPKIVREGSAMNDENLITFKQMQPERHKELSRLGGIASGQTRARRAYMKAAAREIQLRMVYFKDADADLKAEWAEFQRWRRSEKKRRVNAGKRGRKA